MGSGEPVPIRKAAGPPPPDGPEPAGDGAGKPGRKGRSMLVSTIVMGALALALVALGACRGRGEHLAGLRAGGTMCIEVLPMLLLAFVVAGMMQSLIPPAAITRWVGTESGLKGILVGSVAGGLMPGGPYVNLPIAAGLLRGGAGIGTLVAFLTGWSLWAASRLPMEAGFLGWRFMLMRLASVAVFPPAAGLIARALFERRG